MGVTNRPGVLGKSGAEWEAEVRRHLEQNRPEELQRSLVALRRELDREQACVDQLESVPWYRRSATGPDGVTRAQLSRLRDEVAAERRVERYYSDAVTRAALPACIWPYLKMTPAVVRPDGDGIQFDGFGKFGGVTGRGEQHAVVFFANNATQGVPPHFFTSYQAQEQRFVIERAYRCDLPRGSAAAVVAEQARRICEPLRLRHLGLRNVVNQATYAAYVGADGRLLQDVDFAATPLGKHTMRVLELLGLAPGAVVAQLTGFGELHLDVEVHPRPG